MNKDIFIEKANQLLKNSYALTLTIMDTDGYPRSLAMAILHADSIYEIWFATIADSEKMSLIARSAKAGIAFYDRNESVTLKGDIEIVNDQQIKQIYWKDWMNTFYPNGANDPRICLLKFTPIKGELLFAEQLLKTDLT